MRILILGDVVGRPARRAVQDLVPSLVKNEAIDMVIANAENAAGGIGVDIKSAKQLLAAGVHVLTSGNHVWKKKEIYSYLSEGNPLIRPANYPADAPGSGWYHWRSGTLSVLVINLLGRVFMPNHVDDPFRCVDTIINNHRNDASIVVVDIHAEATSEKNAMGWFLDGRASVVYGTHTHVQTADERVLGGGTAYITDVGMCGAFDSVIGMAKENVIRGFVSQLPSQFEVAQQGVVLQGAIVDIDQRNGMAQAIRRVRVPWEPVN